MTLQKVLRVFSLVGLATAFFITPNLTATSHSDIITYPVEFFGLTPGSSGPVGLEGFIQLDTEESGFNTGGATIPIYSFFFETDDDQWTYNASPNDIVFRASARMGPSGGAPVALDINVADNVAPEATQNSLFLLPDSTYHISYADGRKRLCDPNLYKVVPVPTAVLLFASGLLGLAAFGKRFRRS
jgi:hypothetical protein